MVGLLLFLSLSDCRVRFVKGLNENPGQWASVLQTNEATDDKLLRLQRVHLGSDQPGGAHVHHAGRFQPLLLLKERHCCVGRLTEEPLVGLLVWNDEAQLLQLALKEVDILPCRPYG